ncbi:hypothetical protein D3C79_49440 [compost metagenome]
MSKFPPYVFPTDLAPFEQELHVLSWFRDNFTTNPKKLKQMNVYICPLVPAFIQQNFCLHMAASANPAKFLQRAFKDIDEYPVVIEGLINEGNHGMILDGSTIYGFAIDANEKWLNPEKDTKWTEEDENEIIDKAIISWMAKHRIRKFKGRLVLFPKFGFSGKPFAVDFRFKDPHWQKLQDIYKEEDRISDNAELARLLKEK